MLTFQPFFRYYKKDKSVVDTSSVQVSGTAIPGVKVSVTANGNSETANADQGGNFAVVVPLKEGTNLTEVVASDKQGHEESSAIAVICVHKELGGLGN